MAVLSCITLKWHLKIQFKNKIVKIYKGFKTVFDTVFDVRAQQGMVWEWGRETLNPNTKQKPNN